MHVLVRQIRGLTCDLEIKDSRVKLGGVRKRLRGIVNMRATPNSISDMFSPCLTTDLLGEEHTLI